MSKELTTALVFLRKALEDEGPQPEYHRQVMVETEQRWPTLMRAVRDVLASPEVRKL